jgi:hypothetical protein
MVCSAAISCLSEYATMEQRKPVRDLTIDTALVRLDSKDPAMRKGAIKLLHEIGPARKDVKDKLVIFAKTVHRDETKRALAEVVRGKGGIHIPGADFGGVGDAGGVAVNKVELRRQYLAARQEWIRGGKRGDPPPKPEGID